MIRSSILFWFSSTFFDFLLNSFDVSIFVNFLYLIGLFFSLFNAVMFLEDPVELKSLALSCFPRILGLKALVRLTFFSFSFGWIRASCTDFAHFRIITVALLNSLWRTLQIFPGFPRLIFGPISFIFFFELKERGGDFF